ncbi:UDP-glucose 4-epimerase [Nakamurella sp. UYEF19]|uniref:NAD-dependent epimerase/dehydratase family protein n=1 Tax=Nakamurella sp. UYEF19 TaxID=1756392 RepID=UPI0033995CF6
MAGLTVLITGVTRYIGSALAGRLAAHPDVDRVIGVDAAMPEPAARARMGDAEFARADIRNPLISRVIEAAGVDTVVHASASSTPSGPAARSMAKEMNVLGTMQLLAACQRSDSVRHLIVRSTADVYGGSSRDPAVATEDTQARSVPSAGMARDAIDIEGYVRGFGRRRPDVRVAVPRFAAIIGPTVRTPLTKYLSAKPFVPMVFGHDSRLQLVHELDAVALMEHLTLGDFAGIVNVAGDGAMTVAQAIHRAGGIPLPIPSQALDGVGRAFSLLRLGGFSVAQVRLLAAGRVLDTSRLRGEVGFTPQFTTSEAFDDFVASLVPAVDRRSVRIAETRLASLIGITPEPERPWASKASPASRAVAVAEIPDRPRLFSIDGESGRPVVSRAGRPAGRKR